MSWVGWERSCYGVGGFQVVVNNWRFGTWKEEYKVRSRFGKQEVMVWGKASLMLCCGREVVLVVERWRWFGRSLEQGITGQGWGISQNFER